VEIIALILIVQEASAVGVDILLALGHIILLTFPKPLDKAFNPTFKFFLQ
jgi:hypothetical protein